MQNLFNIDKEINNESVNSSDEKTERFQEDEAVSVKKKKREAEKSMEENEVPEEEKDIKREVVLNF